MTKIYDSITRVALNLVDPYDHGMGAPPPVTFGPT